MTYEQLPLWFRECIKKVMDTNEYADNEITASACDKVLKWSPLDIILREHYSHKSSSAWVFCGLARSQNHKAARYAIDNQDALKELDLYSEKAWWDNSKVLLWNNHMLY